MVVAGILNKELKQVNDRWKILGVFFLIFFEPPRNSPRNSVGTFIVFGL